MAFALTLLLEIPVVLLVLQRGWKKDLPWALLANGLSHPTLWFVLYPAIPDYWTFLVVGETLVFSFEAVIYALAVRSVRGVAASVAANSLSMGVGLLIAALA